jgi:hypothetical protein
MAGGSNLWSKSMADKTVCFTTDEVEVLEDVLEWVVNFGDQCPAHEGPEFQAVIKAVIEKLKSPECALEIHGVCDGCQTCETNDE